MCSWWTLGSTGHCNSNGYSRPISKWPGPIVGLGSFRMANFLTADSTTMSFQTTGTTLWWVMRCGFSITLVQFRGKRLTSKESTPGNKVRQTLVRRPFWSDGKRMSGNILHHQDYNLSGLLRKGSPAKPERQFVTDPDWRGSLRLWPVRLRHLWVRLHLAPRVRLLQTLTERRSPKKERWVSGAFPDSGSCAQCLLYNTLKFHWFARARKLWALSVHVLFKIWKAKKRKKWTLLVVVLVFEKDSAGTDAPNDARTIPSHNPAPQDLGLAIGRIATVSKLNRLVWGRIWARVERFALRFQLETCVRERVLYIRAAPCAHHAVAQDWRVKKGPFFTGQGG